MRKTIGFNDNWLFIKEAADAEKAMAACLDKGLDVTLPHTWNAIDGQDGGNDYHRGTCWYVKTFNRPEMTSSDRVFLDFPGVAMIADVWVNGQHLCHHEGGFSTVRVDVTEVLTEENTIILSVDNDDNDILYPQKADFTFYGGIYRSVSMIVVPKAHFDLSYVGSTGVRITPEVDLDAMSASVTMEAWVKGDCKEVTFSIGNQKVTASLEDGYGKETITLNQAHLWHGLEDPFLYTAIAELDSGDKVETRFGCRSFDVDPQKGFFLNGKPYLLRGVSRHQDFKDAGNAITMDHQLQDIAIIKEIGATTLRLAHYQHSQEFYDLCDENGIIVWAEIPYITMHMKNARQNTLTQMEELVVQNYHHPSIVVWGLSNEITAASVVDEDLLENHRLLNDMCHRLDPTRLTTLANVFMLETDSPLLEIPDINSYNLYFGWYLGELKENDLFFDEYHAKYPDRCIGFSEYGADANPQYQSTEPEKGDYTESYQAVYHEHILKMINERPWLWATHVWNLFDFAADGRDEGGKHGENQKGLVTFDRSIKKDAFYLYKAAWNKEEDFVHLCGSRYVDRTETETEIKVYSNCSIVELYVDGVKTKEQENDTVFKFTVPITGDHVIEARSGQCIDAMKIRKVDEANPAYTFRKSTKVNNWFDADESDPTCFSIMDTLGDINAHPEAKVVVDGMMNKDVDQRGDVAAVVKDNPALKRMMERQTLISLLKHGAVTEEQVKQIQRVLQGIKK